VRGILARPRCEAPKLSWRRASSSLWGQTDLFSLGSDRFRIFSAQAKGAFQCHEISPRVRFALEQSGESRRQVRDALGAGEAKDRHELGAGGLGMVLRQVGEGSAGRRPGATRGELAPVDPVPAAHRLDHPGEIQSSKQASLPAQVAMGLIAEALAQAIQESLTAEEPSMPCLGEPRGQTDLEFLVEKILNRSGLAPRKLGKGG